MVLWRVVHTFGTFFLSNQADKRNDDELRPQRETKQQHWRSGGRAGRGIRAGAGWENTAVMRRTSYSVKATCGEQELPPLG